MDIIFGFYDSVMVWLSTTLCNAFKIGAIIISFVAILSLAFGIAEKSGDDKTGSKIMFIGFMIACLVGVIFSAYLFDLDLMPDILKSSESTRTARPQYQAHATKQQYQMLEIRALTPTQKIQEKIRSLAALNSKLEQKKSEVASARAEYGRDIQRLKKEIKYEAGKSGGITSYAEAVRNKRINSDLMLIQRQLAYVDKLNELEFQLNLGTEELLYLEREAQTDLVMAKVLDKEDELVKKIADAIKNYEPYTEKFVIEKGQLNLRPPEQIWRDIQEGKI